MSAVGAVGRQRWHQCDRIFHNVGLVFYGGDIASARHEDTTRETEPARIVLEDETRRIDRAIVLSYLAMLQLANDRISCGKKMGK
jgi:hypothetical protein